MKPSTLPPPPPRRRHVARGFGTALLVATSFVASTLSVAVSAPPGSSGLVEGLSVLGWFFGIGVATLVVFHRRYPVVLTLVSCGGALLLPLDAFAALVGLTGVIASRDRRTSWLLGLLVGVATTVSFVRDLVRSPEHALFATSPDTGQAQQVGWWVYVVMIATCLAVSVSIGYTRRARGEAAASSAQVAAQATTTAALRSRVSRQDERELIAREVHDALASRLSLVSLHAGALEVAVPPDQDDLRGAARVVRENAHASLEDLRDLVALLKDPQGLAARQPGAPESPTDLTSIQGLVDSTRGTGVPLVATVLLEDARAASPQLGRAAFRIVQESLTNARKHAPGLQVDLDVRASASAGVRIVVRNALPVVAGPPAPGSRTGVAGILARAQQLGGQASARVVGDRFVVEAWLPWTTAPAAPGRVGARP